MSDLGLERRQTVWDLVLGAVLVIAGFVVLGHTVLATAVSVLFIGWFTLVSGLVALLAALFRIGRGGFLCTALSGGLLTVLGLMFVRNPAAAALTLTLIAGSLFLVSGVTRLVAAVQDDAYRWALLFGGIVSSVLVCSCWLTWWRRPSRCWVCCWGSDVGGRHHLAARWAGTHNRGARRRRRRRLTAALGTRDVSVDAEPVRVCAYLTPSVITFCSLASASGPVEQTPGAGRRVHLTLAS